MRIFRVKTPSRAIDKTSLLAAECAGIDDATFVFCESRASLSYELAVADKAGGSFGVNVLSFSRYVALHAKVDKYLGKTASALVIRKIIEERSDRLTRFKRGSAELAVTVYEMISQLKSAKVTAKDVAAIAEREKDAFKIKLEDIAVIYEEYEKFISEGGYTDENSYLSLMPELLRADDKIKGAKVIVSGIGNLTKKTVDILIALEKLTDLTVVTVSGEGEGYTNEIFYKLLELFPNVEVEEDEPLPPVQSAIAKGLFDPLAKKAEGLCVDNIRLFERLDATDEARSIAKRIRYEVVEHGKRYNDFVIAASKVTEFAPLYKRVFEEYGIPLYVDEKRGLISHPMVALFFALADLKRFNFKPDIALDVALNPLAFGEEEGGAFENYLISVNPSRKMMTKPFSEAVAESVREKAVSLVRALPTKSTVNGYIDGFLNIFTALQTERRCIGLADKFALSGEGEAESFTRLGYEAFIDVLDQAALVSGDSVVTLDVFKSLISTCVRASEISLIATGYDRVFFGDTSTAALRTSDTLFFVGLDLSVPDVKKDVALLCDRELIKLDGYECVVEPKIRIVNEREREKVMTTLLSFKENLFLSFARIDVGGNKTYKSSVVDFFEKKLGVPLEIPDEEEKARLKDIESKFDYLSARTAAKGALKAIDAFCNNKLDKTTYVHDYIKIAKESDKSAYKSIIDYISPNNELFDKGINFKGSISASLIETYFSCPYKAFAERILRLTRPQKGEAASYEIGLIFHEALEKFAPLCDKIKPRDVEAAALAIADEVLSKTDYARYLNKKQYEYIFPLIKEEIVRACKRVYNDLKIGSFKVYGTEIKFANFDGAPLKAVPVSTINGVKQINGVIDRVDVDGKKARIIDYKTGSTVGEKASAENLYTGNSIQLYLYMNALSPYGFDVVGAHYMGITDSFKKEGESNIVYAGRMIDDDETAERFERAEGGAELADGSFGMFPKGSSSVATKEELKAFADYALKITQTGADEIYKGLFVPSPYGEKACEYCELKGMCGYDCESGTRTRKVDSVTVKTITDALNGGEESE